MMSHYSIYKTRLANVTVDLLKQAITSLARQIGAEVVTAVKDYYKHPYLVTIGLKNKNLPNGIGFGVSKDGVLTVDGDAYGQWEEFNRIKVLAQNYIKAYKVAQNALAIHPTARIQTKVEGKAVVLEVAV